MRRRNSCVLPMYLQSVRQLGPAEEASLSMIAHIVRVRLILTAALILTALPILADTVVRPLSINGRYDLSPLPHFEQVTDHVDLGITFAQISSAGLRLEANVRQGSVRELGSLHVEHFLPSVTGSLIGDDDGVAAFGETLLPPYYRSALALDHNFPPAVVDYSPLLDGKAELKFSVAVPLMTANTTITAYPAVNLIASALVVTGEALGRLVGDFDGDGSVFIEDYDVFKRTFGQHVRPGTGADANGDGFVDVADYVPWRDHLSASIRPTEGYLAGDFDYSGAVDVADYNFWKARFGRAVAPFSGADGNGSGKVDAADYQVWRDQLGQSLPGYSFAAAPVPEPAAFLLAALSIVAMRLPRSRQ